ncbi:MAG TPA: hypothetical protein VNQ76_06320 [Planctomicrobium sp.]|nr:hypothetical protein [Planctomicrobium sp.]
MSSRSKPSASSEIEDQLAEKDELITVLTSQLELAVERLDRLRRAGAERQSIPSSVESVSHQDGRDLNHRLTAVLDEWDELRPIERMDRLEEGLSHLLDWVQQQPPSGIIAATSSPPQSNTQFWEEAKSRLMQGRSDSIFVEESKELPTSGQTSQENTLDDYCDTELPPPPRPIAPTDDATALFAAVENRDQYIRSMTERLRQIQRTRWFPANWDQLQNTPDQYQQRLQHLDSMLQEQLRLAEISHSLERADLTRERARLNQMKNNLELQIKRLSNSKTIPSISPPALHPEPAHPPAKNESDSYWKRLFTK